jgi:hypothetical protein
MQLFLKSVMAMGWVSVSGFCQRGMNQVMREIMRRVGVEDDRLRAAGLLSEAECAWLDNRKGIPHSDYGRHDHFTSGSCYADDPCMVVGGLRRALFAISIAFDVFGPQGANLELAPEAKWACGAYGTWQGITFSAPLGLMWLPAAKALRTASYLHEMADGKTEVDCMPVILGFLNHVVSALNQFQYALPTLWRWYDANKERAHDALMTPATAELEAINRLKGLIVNSPGTTMLRTISKKPVPFGAVAEYNNDSDACFDTVTEGGIVCRGTKDPPGMGGFCFGAYWNHVFCAEDLQLFTIPVAEFTAAVLNLHVMEEDLELAKCIVMNVDALATPQALTTRAVNKRMQARQCTRSF